MPKTTETGKAKTTSCQARCNGPGPKPNRRSPRPTTRPSTSTTATKAAHQVAFAALKHTHEKVGDHWEPKDEYGPSDPQAEGGKNTVLPTAGGVDANATKGTSTSWPPGWTYPGANPG